MVAGLMILIFYNINKRKRNGGESCKKVIKNKINTFVFGFTRSIKKLKKERRVWFLKDHTEKKMIAKTLKKFLLGIVLVLAIVLLSTNSYASITTSTNTENITITGLENGVTVTLYQLITVNYDYTTDQPSDPAYTWVSTVNDYLASTSGQTPDYSAYVDSPETFYSEITSKSEEAATFYNTLSAAVKSNTVSLAVYKTDEAGSTGELTFTNCAMGTYLVLVDNGYNVYQPTVVNLVPEFDGSTWVLESTAAEIKSKSLSITKTAGTSTAGKDNYSTADTISFTILADVPTYLSGSVSKAYYISDTVSTGLTYDASTLKVYGILSGNSIQLTEANGDFSIGTTRPDDSSTAATFVLNFDYDKISSYTSIRVEYNAKLNSNTTLNMEDGNTNTAYLDYSNNAYTSTIATQSSTFTVYTYGIEVTKVDKSYPTTTLSGAEFSLSDEDGNVLSFVGSNGVYYLANSGDNGATTTLVVDNDGKLCLYGLDVGTYKLNETKAPDGYNLSQTTETIILEDAEPDGILDDADETDGITTLTFKNSSGFVLPVTGGIGTVVFAMFGIVLFGLGIVLLVFFLKKRISNK